MKLLTKNTITLLLVTVIVFLLGGFLFYYQLNSIMDEEAMESLSIKKEEILLQIKTTNKLPEENPFEGGISLTKTNKKIPEIFSNTTEYNVCDEEELPYKQLCFPILFEKQYYKCTIRKSLFESEDLIETILISFTLIISILILIFIGINYLFSKKIWKPFLTTIEQINKYELDKNMGIKPETSSVKEFQQLNDAISKMTTKITSDYEKLKNFTENASHELQTPLAIIKGKTELLIQGQGLSEEQIKLISEIDQTANRLRKLNQTLLLLSKIENNQFKTNEYTDIAEILKNKLEQVEDLISMKKLQLKTNIETCTILIHPVLADILISNLISNALRYTPENGNISIQLNPKELVISNTGKALQSNPEKIFDRFHKEGESSESTGLGLALVKQIAVINKHQVSYHYSNDMHIFKYIF